jgi:hypothetical protein
MAPARAMEMSITGRRLPGTSTLGGCYRAGVFGFSVPGTLGFVSVGGVFGLVVVGVVVVGVVGVGVVGVGVVVLVAGVGAGAVVVVAGVVVAGVVVVSGGTGVALGPLWTAR